MKDVGYVDNPMDYISGHHTTPRKVILSGPLHVVNNVFVTKI